MDQRVQLRSILRDLELLPTIEDDSHALQEMLDLPLLRVLHDKRVLHLHYRGHVLRQFLNHSALILRGGTHWASDC